jgi:flagellar biosynthetic protein FliR
MPEDDTTQLIAALRALFGGDLAPWLLAWARVTPTLILVPAFGAAAVPVAARAGLGVALAAAIAPRLAPLSATAMPFGFELLRQAALGTPIALGAAVLVYAAVMAGGAIDDLRGARETASLSVFEGPTTSSGTLLGLLVIVLFLEFGGASRAVDALAHVDRRGPPLTVVVAQLSGSIELALAVAAPLAAFAIVLSVAEGLIARASVPAHVTSLLAPLRGIALLSLFALLLDRMLELFALTAR